MITIKPVSYAMHVTKQYALNAASINTRALQLLKKHPNMELSKAVEVTISNEAKALYLKHFAPTEK